MVIGPDVRDGRRARAADRCPAEQAIAELAPASHAERPSKRTSPRGCGASNATRSCGRALSDLFVHRGLPEHIRSDNGSEFTAKSVREWLGRVGVKTKTLFIEPGSPWENGYVESFNGKLRDELLALEVFDKLLEAKVLNERRRQHYHTVRPHSALGYRPPAPEARQPCAVASATAQCWSVGGQKPNLETGVIHGGRSVQPPYPIAVPS